MLLQFKSVPRALSYLPRLNTRQQGSYWARTSRTTTPMQPRAATRRSTVIFTSRPSLASASWCRSSQVAHVVWASTDCCGVAKVNTCRQLPQTTSTSTASLAPHRPSARSARWPNLIKKPTLLTSPGLRLIFNNKAADGYWNSAHMMVQAEAVEDVS